jgi:hypothetical protein
MVAIYTGRRTETAANERARRRNMRGPKQTGHLVRIWCIAAPLIAPLIMTSPAHAEAVAAGVGVRTCAQFAQDYKNNPANAETIYNNWALGFLSGLNAAADANGTPRRNLEAMSFNDKKQFMRDYCDQHPLQLYLDGVLQLGLSLPLMRGNRPK